MRNKITNKTLNYTCLILMLKTQKSFKITRIKCKIWKIILIFSYLNEKFLK
jgi:hypothetical protein